MFIRIKRKREEEPATHMSEPSSGCKKGCHQLTSSSCTVAEVAIPGHKKPRGVFTYRGTETETETIDDPDYVPVRRLNS